MAAKKKEAAKKDAPKRKVIMVTTDDGREIKRVEYIRELYAEGMKPAEIAKKLGVRYQIVWQALKKVRKPKEEEEAVSEAPVEAVLEVEDDEEF